MGLANARTFYPPPFDLLCRARERKKLGDADGLTQFGVNLLKLPAGSWSSQRHWHTASDEFVYVLAGEVTLVIDDGEELLRAGDAAGFRAEIRTAIACKIARRNEALVLEVGIRIAEDSAYYSDIDMVSLPVGSQRSTPTGTGPLMRASNSVALRGSVRRGHSLGNNASRSGRPIPAKSDDHSVGRPTNELVTPASHCGRSSQMENQSGFERTQTWPTTLALASFASVPSRIRMCVASRATRA